MIYDINNLRTRFENIYSNNTWNMGQNETLSGLGSTLSYTTSIRKSLVEIIKQKNIKNMIDTSCGEWNWQKQIKHELCDYTGIDIVKEVIDRNNTLYKNEKINWQLNGSSTQYHIEQFCHELPTSPPHSQFCHELPTSPPNS